MHKGRGGESPPPLLAALPGRGAEVTPLPLPRKPVPGLWMDRFSESARGGRVERRGVGVCLVKALSAHAELRPALVAESPRPPLFQPTVYRRRRTYDPSRNTDRGVQVHGKPYPRDWMGRSESKLQGSWNRGGCPGTRPALYSCARDPRGGELYLGRMKPWETTVEVRRCSDVQIDFQTWAKGRKTHRASNLLVAHKMSLMIAGPFFFGK